MAETRAAEAREGGCAGMAGWVNLLSFGAGAGDGGGAAG